MNPEGSLPLGVRLALAFLRFLRLGFVLMVVFSLLGASMGSWLTGAQGEDLQAGITAVLVGLGGIVVSNLLHAANLFVEALIDQILVAHLRSESADGLKDSKVFAVREWLDFARVSFLFVFVVLALLVGLLGLSRGFNECGVVSFAASVLLVGAGVVGYRVVKRRVTVVPVDR